jgi:hypothetical protein
MNVKTVYLVKFDRGYYATKQTGWHWSYTDDIYFALPYKTRKKAEEKGKYGINLINKDECCQSYVIEEYQIKTVMELKNERED